MKKFFLLVLFGIPFISIRCSEAQNVNYDKQFFFIKERYDIAFLIRIDGNIFKYFDYGPRDYKKKIFLNDKALDSAKLEFNTYPTTEVIVHHGSIYNLYSKTDGGITGWINNFSTTIYEVDLVKQRINRLNNYKNTFIDPLRDFYSARVYGNDSIVYKIYPRKGELEVLIDVLPNFLYPLNIYSFLDLEEITYINKNEILLEYADCEGGCADYRSIIYNLSDKTYREAKFINDLSREQTEADKYKVSLFNLKVTMNDLTDNYLYGYFEEVKTRNLNDDYIFDDHLNIVSPALKKISYGNNYNYDNGIITSVMLHTKLDDGKKVFVPYKFTLPLERTYFRVFNNEPILPEDLKAFGEYELSMVKNFIFAKHNFKFDSEFYQAYFNLFAFYNSEEKTKSRGKEVNHFLTEADKKSLKIITKSLKKYLQ